MDLINNSQDRQCAINKLFSNENTGNKDNNTNVKEIIYGGYKFRIGKRNEGYTMSVYLEGIGYVGFKSCNSMSECWDTLNNFNINYLFS